MLVNENELLVVYIPATSRALVFRVKSVVNRNYRTLFYGPLPFTAGSSLPTFDGGTTTVPADGVLPARAYEPDGITFPLYGAYDSTDMWYLPEESKDRLFHVVHEVTPSFVRVDLKIPIGVTQARFQRERVVVGVEKDFGFNRGFYEAVHLPKIHYGYRYANDTNMSVYTSVKFTYAEYIVDIPKDSELIYSILTRKVQTTWVTLPISVYDPSIKDAVQTIYGFEGFPIYGQEQRAKALEEYSKLLKEVKI